MKTFVACLLACLPSLAIASIRAEVPAMPARAPEAAWIDGAFRIEAWRVGEEEGRTLALLRDDVGRTWTAGIDDFAVVAGDVRGLIGIQAVRTLLPSRDVHLVRSTRGFDGLAIAQQLAPDVVAGRLRYALPNTWVRHTTFSEPWTPDDTKFPEQWFFNRLQMTRAWGLHRGDAATTVAVVDTGCDATHPDLAAKLDEGYDAIDDDTDPTWKPGAGEAHGTECAGLVGAVTDNGQGIAGACPDCRIRCVRLLGGDGERVPLSADVDAFEWIRAHGIAVASNSWGFIEAMPVPSALREAIDAAHDEGRDGLGTVVVFASGNDDREISAGELLTVEGVLGVGALTRYDERTTFSNFGRGLDLSSYAGTVTTDISGPDGSNSGDYTNAFGGTSSACPIVAGVAGLVASADPALTSAELDALLVETAKPTATHDPDESGRDPVFGFGVVDPESALKRALQLVDVPDAGTVVATDGGNDGGGGDAPGCGCGASGTFLLALPLLLQRRRR